MIEALLDALLDPWPPFTFCCPQAIVDQDAGVSIPNISLLPLDEAPVHVHPFAARALAIRKAPSASVESIEPRPPQPCEVGRPKGRRRKSRRKSHNFLTTDPAGRAQLARHALGRLPHSSRGRGRPELGPSRLSDMGWAGILG